MRGITWQGRNRNTKQEATNLGTRPGPDSDGVREINTRFNILFGGENDKLFEANTFGKKQGNIASQSVVEAVVKTDDAEKFPVILEAHPCNRQQISLSDSASRTNSSI